MNVLDWIIIVVLSPFAFIAALYSIMILCMAFMAIVAGICTVVELITDCVRGR